MPFVRLAALMFFLGDVFDGHRQHDDVASVPLLTPHAKAGHSLPPLWVVHGRRAVGRTCKMVWELGEWVILLLLLSGLALDADECPVRELVRMDKVPTDQHIAVTSVRDGGVVEQGTTVVYHAIRSMALWGAQNTTASGAIKFISACDVHQRPHALYHLQAALSQELPLLNTASLERVLQSPHSDAAWMKPHRYCSVPTAAKVRSSDASSQEDGATNIAVVSCHSTHYPMRKSLGQQRSGFRPFLPATQYTLWIPAS